MRVAGILLFAATLLIPTLALSAEAGFVTQKITYKREVKFNVFQKLVKESTSKEGQAVVAAGCAYLGCDPASVSGALYNLNDQLNQTDEQDQKNYLRPPPGYTTCTAFPLGSQYNGVESTEDSTFNATVARKGDQDFLALYTVVPRKVGRTVRVMATFDVIFVSKRLGWKSFPDKCLPSGTSAWLSRNNNTRLNVPNTVPSWITPD
ncbi:hypothetical protein [Mesorhizobium sp. M0019]|uniref:hypothetical protein n=1 Tax=Mesorhizobium sp. M0019 TaxID=2956845 RepID=UPI00333C4B78